MENIQNGAGDSIVEPSDDKKSDIKNQQPTEEKTKSKVKKPTRKIFVLAIALLAIAIGVVLAGYFMVYKPANDYAIKVGKIEVSSDDYAYYKTQYPKYQRILIQSDKDLNNYIVDSLKYVSAVEETKTEIAPADIQAYVSDNYGVKSNPWLEFIAKAELSKVIITNTGDAPSYAQYGLPFCKSFVMDRTTAEGYGDEAQIEADRKYAEDKANTYMKAIADNPTVALAKSHVAEILKDEKLDYGFAGNQSSVFKLTSDDKQYESPRSIMLISPETIELLKKLSDESPVSSLLTETRNVSVIDKYATPDTPIAYYFFVKLSDKSLDFDYESFAKNLEVKINV